MDGIESSQGGIGGLLTCKRKSSRWDSSRPERSIPGVPCSMNQKIEIRARPQPGYFGVIWMLSLEMRMSRSGHLDRIMDRTSASDG